MYCEKSENKIKAEHQKKFKFLCFRTCSHGVFEIKMTYLMCSSNFSAYNMTKNILNHYTTKKGRKHKKLGIWSNGHVGESSGTQKNLNFCIARNQKVTVRSSTEDEYPSIAQTSTELTWIHTLLTELQVSFTTVIFLW